MKRKPVRRTHVAASHKFRPGDLISFPVRNHFGFRDHCLGVVLLGGKALLFRPNKYGYRFARNRIPKTAQLLEGEWTRALDRTLIVALYAVRKAVSSPAGR